MAAKSRFSMARFLLNSDLAKAWKCLREACDSSVSQRLRTEMDVVVNYIWFLACFSQALAVQAQYLFL